MYKPDQIIDALKKAKHRFPSSSIEFMYYDILANLCILEVNNQKKVNNAGVSILHYFKYNLPQGSYNEFECLYNPCHSVRYACDKFTDRTGLNF